MKKTLLFILLLSVSALLSACDTDMTDGYNAYENSGPGKYTSYQRGPSYASGYSAYQSGSVANRPHYQHHVNNYNSHQRGPNNRPVNNGYQAYQSNNRPAKSAPSS